MLLVLLLLLFWCFIFTARRYAKRGICRRRVSVCLSVCVSVTLRYCIKTAKRRITQIMPHDSPGTLVFWHQSSRRNWMGSTHTVSECQSDECGEFAIFAQNRLPWQRPLRYRKKGSGSIIYTQKAFIRCKSCENRSSGSWDNLSLKR